MKTNDTGKDFESVWASMGRRIYDLDTKVRFWKYTFFLKKISCVLAAGDLGTSGARS